MICQRVPAIAVMALTIAGLCLPVGDLLAGPAYRSPPAAPPRPAPDTFRTAPWYIPADAPLNRTYTWYAPPAGYEVIWQATPSEPRFVTVVGPDGISRIVRMEGPLVTRLRYVNSRSGPR
jgi:hypothetical protein